MTKSGGALTCTDHRFSLAGVEGFEPSLTVLETAVLAVDTIPL
jgi:hypothetical protein